MASVDTEFGMKISNALDASTIATDTTTVGEIINMNDGTNDFESLVVSLRVGAFTDGDYSLVLTESDTVGGTYTAVAAADIVGTNAVIEAANTVSQIGYVGKKQFVKVSCLSANTSSGAHVSAVAIQGTARQTPLG